MLFAAWQAARAPWPELTLSPETFIPYLAARWPRPDRPGSAADLLHQVRLGDLYLACACYHNVTEAAATLEREHLVRLLPYLENKGHPPDLAEEVLQRVREKLLVHAPDRAPRISSYVGEGALHSYLQVIAGNEAVDLQRERQRLREDSDRELSDALVVAEPELALLLGRCREEVREALCRARAALDDDRRALLKLRHIDRLTTTEIGRIFGVDHSNISRRLRDTHATIFEHVKTRLRDRLALTPEEFQSLIETLTSHLDLSMGWLLGPTP